MARKKIQEFTNEALQRNAKVYRDSEWNEYRVVFYVAGVKQEGADMHTDDKGDALNTAENWTNGKI